jgi:predicted O-methyltransferase YrrM
MLKRCSDFSAWFGLSPDDQKRIRSLAESAAAMSAGMTHLQDYCALGAVCLAVRPQTIFEIGTYLGVTSDFFLKILPDVHVISIAYINPYRFLFGKRYNNSELRKRQVGSAVERQNRSRFTQIYGSSHDIDPQRFVSKYAPVDLVLIDGDHSGEGVAQDTRLAQSLISPGGTICWHDANPKERYLSVRRFLESMPLSALATQDDYIGGVACWNSMIEEKLYQEQS